MSAHACRGACGFSRRRVVMGMLAGWGVCATGLTVWRAGHAQVQREIPVVVQRFRFEPRVIEVKAGEAVVLLLHSLDYIHGFNVPDLGIRSDLFPGRVTPISLPPQPPGRLDFLCDNFCGEGHEVMHGYLDVTE